MRDAHGRQPFDVDHETFAEGTSRDDESGQAGGSAMKIRRVIDWANLGLLVLRGVGLVALGAALALCLWLGLLAGCAR